MDQIPLVTPLVRPDIPSIVVHNGSASAPGSPGTERHVPIRQSRSLSKQDSLSGDGQVDGCDVTDLAATSVDEIATSSQSEISDSGAVCTPTSCTEDNLLYEGTDNPPSRSLSPHIDVSESGDIDALCYGVENMAVGRQASPGCDSRSNSLELPRQRSQDSDSQGSIRGKKSSSSKTKLLQRSLAMREDTSPPPELLECRNSTSPTSFVSNNLTVTNSRSKKLHQRVSLNNISPVISKAFASLPTEVYKEYENLTDSNGVQTVAFLVNTLCERPHDRQFLLKVERECVLVLQSSRPYKFSQSSSYNRMLIHRVAALYQLSHNVDLVNASCVIIERNSASKEPPFKFVDILNELADDSKRQILKRQCTSCEDFGCSSDLRGIMESRRTKSYEEREEEYVKTRKRIFGDEHAPGDCMRRHLNDPPRGGYVGKHDYDHHRYHDGYKSRSSRMHKYNSLETQGSLDPRSMRPTVVKAFSFGGIGQKPTLLPRGESDAGHHSQASLHKQDSQTSKTSDYTNSSGYKTRQISHDSSANVSAFSTTPSPTAIGPHTPFGQFGGMIGMDSEAQAVLWAVTDMDAVPTGAMLINPQSGQPVCNKDGTVYKFDRSNPPTVEPGSTSRGRHYESGEADDKKPRNDSQYSNPPAYIAAQFSQESDLNGPMRSMSIAGSASGSETGSDPQSSNAVNATNCAVRPQSYQQQPLYYGPQMVPTTGALPQGGKYVFPPVTSVPPPMPDTTNALPQPPNQPTQDVTMTQQPHYVSNYALVPVHPNGFVNPPTEGMYYPSVPLNVGNTVGQPHNLIPTAPNNQNYPMAAGYFNPANMPNTGVYAPPPGSVPGVANYPGTYYNSSIPANQLMASAGTVAPANSQNVTGQSAYVGGTPRPADQMVGQPYLIIPPTNQQNQILVRPPIPHQWSGGCGETDFDRPT